MTVNQMTAPTTPAITVETESVRRCREAREALDSGRATGRELARVDYFEYDLIGGMLAALAPGELAIYGEQSAVETAR